MSKRLNTLVLFTLTAFAFAGCRIHSTVASDGSAKVEVKYRVGKNVTLEVEKKRFESDSVTVMSASVDEDSYASLELKVDDFTKLSTAKFFGDATITSTNGENGTKVLTAKIVRKKPQKLSAQALEYVGKEIEVAVTVPGEIVSSNATKTEDNTVSWSYDMNEFLGAEETSMTVTYKLPAKAAKG